ncbi:MAG TPA: hypothetical protein VNX88_03690 [Terriglobales bacterium]|jgi:hypothetical protein|nr:hypothetical protein [Terriglobales bacterium]
MISFKAFSLVDDDLPIWNEQYEWGKSNHGANPANRNIANDSSGYAFRNLPEQRKLLNAVKTRQQPTWQVPH